MNGPILCVISWFVQVWSHFDDNSCAGQATGIRVRLENGITGFIPTKFISDSHVRTPEDRVKIGMVIHCRVLRLNTERFTVDLSCRSSDLADKESRFGSVDLQLFLRCSDVRLVFSWESFVGIMVQNKQKEKKVVLTNGQGKESLC